MLISLKYKFLFIHIAKTGGTSIRSALQRYRWRDTGCWWASLCNRISSLWGHRIGVKIPRHAKTIAAKEMLPKETFDSLFKFAFVRNPWDLQVSSWHHIKRERAHIIPDTVKTFEDFILWKADKENRPYHYIIDTSMEYQTDYLVDLHRRPIVNFVGRYETLNRDFKRICSIIEINPPVLPHKRQAKDRKKDYRSYYTDRLAEIVGELFEIDISFLGYSFDAPPLSYEPIIFESFRDKNVSIAKNIYGAYTTSAHEKQK